MKLKTLLFSLSALVFFAACNSNTTTENASIQTPTNTVFNSTEVMSNNNEIVEIEEAPTIEWIKYASHEIWNTNIQSFEKSIYNRANLDNPNFFNEIDTIYEFDRVIYYNSEDKSIDAFTDGRVAFNTKTLTEYGYLIDVLYGYDDEVVDLSYYKDFNRLSSKELKSTDKLYGGFRKNGKDIELVINHLDKNKKLLNQDVYISNTEDYFLLHARIKGNYRLTNLQNNESLDLYLNKNYKSSGFKHYNYYYLYTILINGKSQGVILFSTCPYTNIDYDKCPYLSVKNTELYGIKYTASTKTFTLHLLNNVEGCYDGEGYDNGFESPQAIIVCGENISFGKAVYKMTLQ